MLWLVPLALPAGAGNLVQQGLFFLAAALSVAGTIAAARVTIRHERLAWLMMGLGASLMLSGDLIAILSDVGPRQPLAGATSLTGLLWTAAYVPYLAAFNLFLQPSHNGLIERVRRIFELVLLISLATLILYSAVLYPLYGRGAATGDLSTTLPFFISLSISCSLLIHVASRRPKLPPWHLPVLAALIIVFMASVADGIVSTGEGLGPWSTGLGGLPWFLSYGLLATAGLERVRFKKDVPPNYSVILGSPQPAWGMALSLLLFALLPLFVYVDAVWVGDPLGDLTFSLLISVTAVVAIARNLVIAIENTSLRRYATTDPLTGAYNHRHFHDRLVTEIKRAERTGSSLSVVELDIDAFDRVNNVYGHAAGDRRLRTVAERLMAASRSTDVVCRIGGDEFALIMPDTDPLDAYKMCLRLQDQLHRPDSVCPLPVGLSVGIASLPEHARNDEELVQRADGALYWAKFHGRDQIVIYDPTLVRSLGPKERIAKLEEESYVNMVQLLSSAVDARDPYTHHHSRRVAELAVALAREVGMTDADVALLETAALLHDVGKIGVPDSVLRKVGPLSEDERTLVNEHPLLATRILAAIPRREILPWIAAHHERWDGTGYPKGLQAEDIPLQGRILALCDAFDAMTSDRPYRRGYSFSTARLEVMLCAGTQFDPELAERFIMMAETRPQERIAQ